MDTMAHKRVYLTSSHDSRTQTCSFEDKIPMQARCTGQIVPLFLNQDDQPKLAVKLKTNRWGLSSTLPEDQN